MEKQEAKQILMDEGRYTFKVEYAEEICKAFGLELNKNLIRTTLGYRENISDPTSPRVNCNSLAEDICKRLGKKPDKKQSEHANRMHGAGSWRDAESKAYAMSL